MDKSSNSLNFRLLEMPKILKARTSGCYKCNKSIAFRKVTISKSLNFRLLENMAIDRYEAVSKKKKYYNLLGLLKKMSI